MAPCRRRGADLCLARRAGQPGALGQAKGSIRQDLRGRLCPAVGIIRGVRRQGRSVPGHEGGVSRATVYDDADRGHAIAERAATRLSCARSSRRSPASIREPVAQGRDGPDAADAADRGRVRRARRVQPDGEHPRRRRLPQEPAVAVTTTTSRWRSPPTTRVPARSKSTVAACRPTARRATTCAKIRAASSNGARTPAQPRLQDRQMVDGREVVRYTNKPAAGAEVVKARTDSTDTHGQGQ